VTPPFLIIAEREFRAYVATLSFWVALVAGPLALGLIVGVAALSTRTPAPTRVAIAAPDPATWRSAAAALGEAAAVEGQKIVILPAGQAGAAARLVLEIGPDGGRRVRVVGSLPLSTEGRLLAQRTIERDEALSALRAAGGASAPDYRLAVEPPGHPTRASGVLGRFGVVMMLWLTLTGSLGMLLQSVARERVNRSLESLLAAVSPAEIVFGKLVGVGAVSALVLGAWLGSAAALGRLMGAVASLGGLAPDPIALVLAVLVYVMGFGFYGLVTIAVGASARDAAQAQNLSRPMFAVLLAAFFVALAGALGRTSELSWLVYAPPFTPFLVLMAPPGAFSAGSLSLALGLLAAGAAGAGLAATRNVALRGYQSSSGLFRPQHSGR
jgi:ABC-2 type transport system permease protein